MEVFAQLSLQVENVSHYVFFTSPPKGGRESKIVGEKDKLVLPPPAYRIKDPLEFLRLSLAVCGNRWPNRSKKKKKNIARQNRMAGICFVN